MPLRDGLENRHKADAQDEPPHGLASSRVAFAFVDEAMRNAISEIEPCFLDEAAAKLEAKWFPENLLGLSHAEDCAENLHRLRAV